MHSCGNDRYTIDPVIYNNKCNNTVQLAWNASIGDGGTPHPLVRGYKIHVGNESGLYRTVIDKPLVDSHPMTHDHLVTGLTTGDFYFVVTAYSADKESGYSNEVSTSFTDCLQVERLSIRQPD